MIHTTSPAATEELFGPVVFSYTREQVFEDGILADANIGDLDEVSRQHFPNASVAMTREVFELIEKAVAHPSWHNDWRGVWHDILWMARIYGFPKRSDTRLFKVIITGTGRKRHHVLKAVGSFEGGRPCVTIMFPNQD